MSKPKHSLAPLAGAQLGMAALGVSLATFMQVLDTTIANVSVPTIAGSSANAAPVPMPRPATVPRYSTRPPYTSATTLTGWPMRMCVNWTSLKFASTRKRSSGTTASSGLPGAIRSPSCTPRFAT